MCPAFFSALSFADEVGKMTYCRKAGPMICEGPQQPGTTFLDYESLLAKGSPGEPMADIGEEDLNVIMYTSGNHRPPQRRHVVP